MLRTVEGLIVRAIKYSETSIIFDAYTKELGLKTYIVNGVRKKNGTLSPALFQPMSLVEMVVYHSEEKDINRIKEIKPSYVYQQVPFDVIKGAVGLFITEVAQKTVREPEPNEALYNFLKDCYITLDQTKCKIAYFPVWFLVQYATFLGLTPVLKSLTEQSVFDYVEGKVLPKALFDTIHCFSTHNTHLLAVFLELDFESCTEVVMSGEDRSSFLSDLLRYYQYHLDNFGQLNSITVLHSVFS